MVQTRLPPLFTALPVPLPAADVKETERTVAGSSILLSQKRLDRRKNPRLGHFSPDLELSKGFYRVDIFDHFEP